MGEMELLDIISNYHQFACGTRYSYLGQYISGYSTYVPLAYRGRSISLNHGLGRHVGLALPPLSVGYLCSNCHKIP